LLQTTPHRTYGRHLLLSTVPRHGTDRAELEAFVRAAFERRHAAQVHSFMPTLLGFHDAAGQLKGVVGLRAAADERLFLEQYLDVPVEQAVAAAVGREVPRRQIVEVGNLAGTNCRAAVRMVAQLPAYLATRDYRWIVFTATSAVRGILQGFGAPLVELARADAARIAGGCDEWGSYYDTDPRVFAGFLPDAWALAGFARSESDH